MSRLFPGIANKRGACPPGVLSFFKVTNSVCEAVDTKLIVIRLYWALLCAPERSPSRPNRVDVLDSHVKRPDVSTSGYSGKPRSSSPGTKSGMMRMIGHPLLGE